MSDFKFDIGDRVVVQSVDDADIRAGISTGDIGFVDEDCYVPYCIFDCGRHIVAEDAIELAPITQESVMDNVIDAIRNPDEWYHEITINGIEMVLDHAEYCKLRDSFK